MASEGAMVTKCLNCGYSGGFQSTALQEEWMAACPACGLTLRENDLKMQDELAAMFNESMNFSRLQVTDQQVQATRPPPTPTANFSISQHYHHSSHQVPQVQEKKGLTDSDIISLLSQHEINSSNLSQPQVSLFRNASPEQRERLIELWKISPPQLNDSLAETTIEKEEALARIRYENAAVPAQAEDTNMAYEKPEDVKAAEPYIRSGYEILAERDYNIQAQSQLSEKTHNSPRLLGPHALDPAFSSREWWRDFVGEQPMEYQYGMFEYMNQYQPQTNPRQEDEEML